MKHGGTMTGLKQRVSYGGGDTARSQSERRKFSKEKEIKENRDIKKAIKGLLKCLLIDQFKSF